MTEDRLKGAFEYFDEEKKGFIDCNSMMKALKYNNLPANEEEIQRCLGGRTLTFEEVKAMFKQE